MDFDYEHALKQPRYSGGHTEVMDNLFGPDTKVLGSWVEQDYQGDLIYIYDLGDGKIGVIEDSFGSCSGCDCWEDAGDEQALRNLRDLRDELTIYQNREDFDLNAKPEVKNVLK